MNLATALAWVRIPRAIDRFFSWLFHHGVVQVVHWFEGTPLGAWLAQPLTEGFAPWVAQSWLTVAAISLTFATFTAMRYALTKPWGFPWLFCAFQWWIGFFAFTAAYDWFDGNTQIESLNRWDFLVRILLQFFAVATTLSFAFQRTESPPDNTPRGGFTRNPPDGESRGA